MGSTNQTIFNTNNSTGSSNETNTTFTGYRPEPIVEGSLADVLGEGTAIAAIIVVTLAIFFFSYRKIKSMKEIRLHNDIIREREVIAKQLIELAKQDKLKRKQESLTYVNPFEVSTSSSASSSAFSSVNPLIHPNNNNNSLSSSVQSSVNPLYSATSNSSLSSQGSTAISGRSLASVTSASPIVWNDMYEPVMSKAERSRIRWRVATLIEPTIDNLTNMNELSLQELMASTAKSFSSVAASRNTSMKLNNNYNSSGRSSISRNTSDRSSHSYSDGSQSNINDDTSVSDTVEQDEIQDTSPHRTGSSRKENDSDDEEKDEPTPSSSTLRMNTAMNATVSSRTVNIHQSQHSLPQLVRQSSDSIATMVSSPSSKKGILKRTGPSINEYTFEEEMALRQATTQAR